MRQALTIVSVVAVLNDYKIYLLQRSSFFNTLRATFSILETFFYNSLRLRTKKNVSHKDSNFSAQMRMIDEHIHSSYKGKIDVRRYRTNAIVFFCARFHPYLFMSFPICLLIQSETVIL